MAPILSKFQQHQSGFVCLAGLSAAAWIIIYGKSSNQKRWFFLCLYLLILWLILNKYSPFFVFWTLSINLAFERPHTYDKQRKSNTSAFVLIYCLNGKWIEKEKFHLQNFKFIKHCTIFDGLSDNLPNFQVVIVCIR